MDDGGHVSTLYVRAAELVSRGGAGVARSEGCVAGVRVLCAPSALKMDGARRPCAAPAAPARSVVHWTDEFLIHFTSDVQQVEIRVTVSEPEKADVVVGQCVVDVTGFPDHSAQEMWLTLTPALSSSRSTPGLLLSGGKSPRAERSVVKESEIHLIFYVARTSDHAAVSAKLQEKSYISVMGALSKEPFPIALQLCQLTPQALGDKMAAALVVLLHGSRVVLPFVRALVQQEVSNTSSSSVLFRSNSMAIRVLSAYGRVVGSQYLQDVLGDLVKEVCADDTSYEPDPQVVGPENAAANADHLAKLSVRFLARILESGDSVPAPFRTVCSDLRQIVGLKFADFWPRAVGGFFFLRYLCPAIASPTTTGLMTGPLPSKNARRTLILVTKVLQNVANQTAFNEPWMSKAEECVKEHIPLVEKFLESISEERDKAAAAWAQGAEEKTLPDSETVFKSIGDLKEICIGSFEVDSEEFMDALKQTSRSTKPYTHSGYAAQLKNLGGVVLETQGPTPLWDTSKYTVMNHALCFKMLPIDAEQTAFDLATAATLLVKGQLEKDAEKGPFDDGVFLDWAMLRGSPAFVAFERNLSDLHHVRPEVLPVEARFSFWINVLNALTFHLHVLTDGKAAKFLSESYYAIGGNVFTCDEIAYGILRGNTVKGRGARKNLFFKADDPRRNLVLTIDSKVNFCQVTFSSDSPVLRPYDRDAACVRRAASVYCEKFIQNDLVKTEVVIPKLLEDNKADWIEEDLLQRVLQLVQFVTSRKLDILQTLTNPKCNITVAKSKGHPHPIYWLGQLRTDAKELLQRKEGVQPSSPGPTPIGAKPATIAIPKRVTLNREDLASLSSVVMQASSPSPRSEVPVSPSGWQRAAARTTGPASPLSDSGTKVPLLSSAGSKTNVASIGGSSSSGITRLEPRLREGGSTDHLDIKVRRSPRSPRVGLRSPFASQTGSAVASSSDRDRMSGFQDDASSPRGVEVAPVASSPSPSPPPPSTPSPPPQSTASPNKSPTASVDAGSDVQTNAAPPVPPKPTSAPQSPRSPRNALRRSVPAVPSQAMSVTDSPAVAPASAPPPDSPRIVNGAEVTANARLAASVIRGHLDNLFVDSSNLVEFDVAIKTGKVLMQVRKLVMGHMGWNEMPTNVAQQIPVVELSSLQARFLPESKHAMFVKLVQAFSSAVQDIHLVLDEALFVVEGGGDELSKWKAREPELLKILSAAEKLLQEHREVIAASLSKEDEFFQVLELCDMLRPDLVVVLAKLNKIFDALDKESPERVNELSVLLSKSKSILESGDTKQAEGETGLVVAKQIVSHLNGKLGSVLEALKGTSLTSKGLLMLTTRVRQINALLP